MENQIRELKELMRMQEELQAEITALQEAIKASMGDQEQLVAGAYRVTWKPVTSHRVDTTALKSTLPEIAERFTKTITSRRFCIA